MAKRERGEGGLIKIRGCRFWYAQFYRDGRQIRVSTRTEVKEKAKRELRRVMGDTERGLIPENELRRVRYAALREALLQNYVERGNKSLQTTADGSETIWGLTGWGCCAGANLLATLIDAIHHILQLL